eukprot:6177767-Pleurochrysis_carterae.AAC.4
MTPSLTPAATIARMSERGALSRPLPDVLGLTGHANPLASQRTPPIPSQSNGLGIIPNFHSVRGSTNSCHGCPPVMRSMRPTSSMAAHLRRKAVW